MCLHGYRCLCNYAQVPEQHRGPPAGPLALCLSAPRHRSCLAGVCLSPARRTRADPGCTHWWEAVLSLYKSVQHSNGSCMAAPWLPIALNWRMKRGQAESCWGKIDIQGKPQRSAFFFFLSVPSFCPCPVEQKSWTNLFLLITRTRVKPTIHDCFSVSPH